MLRLGLTGGIGSGKSTVAGLLGWRGAVVIDADAISRELTAAGGLAIKPIADSFGVDFMTADGALDRAKMRQASFSDGATRAALEAIIHPLVARETARLEAAAGASACRCLVFDIPLLVESRRWRQRVDRVLVVDCVAEVQIARVMARSHLDRAEVETIIASQVSRRQRLRAADVVIFNAGRSTAQLARQIELIANRFGYDRANGRTSVILYEYPFNERIRTYLRLEHLFRRLSELVAREHALDHHFALSSIFEVMDVGARADLKSDLLKDLERQRQTLHGYRGNPAISEKALDAIMVQIDHCYSGLSSVTGKAGHALTENDWLMSIRSRVGIPGGTCEFDLPAYYAWQHMPPTSRRADLQRWGSTLAPLAEAVTLLLKMLREAGAAQKVMASAGQFQQNLPQGKTFQLLRLWIDDRLGLIPEISGNRLMVSIRLMRQGSDDRLHATSEDCGFELTLCS